MAALLILLPIPRQTSRTIARLLEGTAERPDTLSIARQLTRVRVDAAAADTAANRRARQTRRTDVTRASLASARRALARRDSVERLQLTLVSALDSSRRLDSALSARAAQARELAAARPPFIAFPAAAAVLGFVVGFGVVFGSELRTPRIAGAAEATRVAGVPILVTIVPRRPDPERMRRSADAAISPLIDMTSESYRRLSMQTSNATAAKTLGVPLVVVVGDEAMLVAVVAVNIAVASARESHTTLLIDADGEAAAAGAILRVPRRPGVSNVLTGRAEWSAVIAGASIGRDCSLDVIPAGRRIRDTTPVKVMAVESHPGRTPDTPGATPEPPGSIAAEPRAEVDADALRSDLLRLGRRYDFMVVVAPAGAMQVGPESVLPMADCLLCVRVAYTTLARLRISASLLRESGLRISGIVLWDADSRPPTTASA